MIKIIALFTMLIDHIGAVFFPGQLMYRYVGRIAMPLFAYCIARGFYYTRNKNKYMGLILLFAFISQVPYRFMLQAVGASNLSTLNILFTWFLALMLIRGIEGVRTMNPFITVALIIIPLAFPFLTRVEYGIYGVLTPLVFYIPLFYGKERKYNAEIQEADAPDTERKPPVVHSLKDYIVVTIALSVLMAVYISSMNRIIYWQLIAVLAVPFIPLFFNVDRKVPLPKIFAYLFYPGHIAILVLINHFF